jgi:LysR family transcriptional regulator, nitrogen assimilation regulatory protein
MDVRQIRDFVAVVRCSSFAAASRDLRVSQPGLGYQVKQLEQELRVRLLQRHARGVSLTQAGETFLNHAESILAAINSAKLAMAAIAGDDQKKIRIGLVPSLQSLGPLLLSSSHQDANKIQLREAYGSELRQALIDGNLDVAICLSAGKPPLRTIPVCSEPLYLIGPKTALTSGRERISVSELAALPLVLGCRARTPRRLLEDAAAAAGIRLQVDQEVETQALLRSLVLHSDRYTVAPYGAFAEEIEKKLLFASRIVDPEIQQVVHAVYPATLPARLEKMIFTLVQVILQEASLPPGAVNLVAMAAE